MSQILKVLTEKQAHSQSCSHLFIILTL